MPSRTEIPGCRLLAFCDAQDAGFDVTGRNGSFTLYVPCAPGVKVAPIKAQHDSRACGQGEAGSREGRFQEPAWVAIYEVVRGR